MFLATGNKVSLRLAVPADRQHAYRWLTQSDLLPRHFGAPLFGERPAPSYQEFCTRFGTGYFDGRRPFDGRAVVIQAVDGGQHRTDIGMLTWHRIDLVRDLVELDIWLGDSRWCGQGRGSEALQLACGWLQAGYGVNRFLMRPSRRNIHALRALRRAGFRETDLEARDVLPRLALEPSPLRDAAMLFLALPLPTAMPSDRLDTVFIDSEFTTLEAPALISFGAVTDAGDSFYAEIDGWQPEQCSPFVRQIVLPLLDGRPAPRARAAAQFLQWLERNSAGRPTRIVSDSGFDRWALAELLGDEALPLACEWLRVPIAYEEIDRLAQSAGLRRHHALDDARALRQAVLGEQPAGADRRQDLESVGAGAPRQRE